MRNHLVEISCGVRARPFSGRNADKVDNYAYEPNNHKTRNGGLERERERDRERETSGENYFLFVRTGYTDMIKDRQKY